MSGAGNNLPIVPTITAGSPSIIQLNQLSYAVQFLVQQDVRPTWTCAATATQAAAANVWTELNMNPVVFDSDGAINALFGNATIVTQGRYAVEACISVEAPNAKDEFVAAFTFVAGANNPHYAQSTVVRFGHRGSSTSISGTAVADNAICLSDIAPMPLYPGDEIYPAVFVSAALTVDYNENTSYIQGRFAAKFSGYWLGEAT